MTYGKNTEIGNYLPKWGLYILIRTLLTRCIFLFLIKKKKNYWKSKIQFFNNIICEIRKNLSFQKCLFQQDLLILSEIVSDKTRIFFILISKIQLKFKNSFISPKYVRYKISINLLFFTVTLCSFNQKSKSIYYTCLCFSLRDNLTSSSSNLLLWSNFANFVFPPQSYNLYFFYCSTIWLQ